MAGSLLAQCNIVWGQTPVVDLRELHAREVKSIVFSLDSPQDLRLEAVGAESTDTRSTFSWITAMWSSKDDRRRALARQCLDSRSANPQGRLGAQRERHRARPSRHARLLRERAAAGRRL
jgi:hypothetical protein